MCGVPDRRKSSTENMDNLTVETEESFSSMLEIASNNDVEGFKTMLERDPSSIDEVGLWYGRQRGSKQIVCERRTPLMIAATYGSVEVLKLILVHSLADVNLACGADKSTALHCAASGGSASVIDVVRLLLSAGAEPDYVDANGHRPIDVIIVPPKLQCARVVLEELLGSKNVSVVGSDVERNLTVSVISSNSSSPALSASASGSPPSPSELVSSPMASKFNGAEKKEYPIDPSLPDIKNSIYATDEFRMFSFKVRPCSRAYSHDWTECPFVHPGENARRRDPRKFHYSCVPCPDFRKGSCRRGDMCEYAHGVFECWLHPAQYRTRLCKDGTSCDRRVCFFAHTAEELRPLYVSSGSVGHSPRSSVSGASVMDMAAALLLPGSPSSINGMSPNPFSQPMSPSGNGNMQSSMWPQPNVPTLNLPGSHIQSSRLRSSLCARDILPEHFGALSDFDSPQQVLNDLTCFSQTRSNSVSLSRSCRPKTLTPSNLEELFSAEISSSPRYSDQAVFSPTPKSAVLSQLQQPQNMLSPIKTSVFSPKNVERPLLQSSFRVGSPGRMSPRSMEPISPMGSRLAALAQREKQQQQQQLRSLSSRDLGSNNPIPSVGSPVNANSWSKWGSPNGKLDWSINGDELDQLRRSSSFDLRNNKREEPDLSWVQSLVKESPPEMLKEKLEIPATTAASSGEALNSNSQVDSVDHSVIGAWLEQMQLDQLVV